MIRSKMINLLKEFYINSPMNEACGVTPKDVSEYLPKICAIKSECKSLNNKNIDDLCITFSTLSFECAVTKSSFNRDFSCKTKAAKNALETRIIRLYHSIYDFLICHTGDGDLCDYEKGVLYMACSILEEDISYYNNHAWET